MIRKKTLLSLAAVALTVAVANIVAHAEAEDWPRWLGPRGDGISAETGLLDKWPDDGPKKLWSIPAGPGYASPIAAAGRVYLFSSVDGKDTLACLDAETGKDIWSVSSEKVFRNRYASARATPCIDGDRIYTFGGGGEVVCRALADGKQVWSLDLLKEISARNLMWGVASCPVIVGDVLYLQGGLDGPAAVAINKNDGKIIWKSDMRDAGYAAVKPIETPAGRQLVVFGSNAVAGLSPKDGKTLWSVPWKTSRAVHATIPVYRDGHLFVTSGYGRGCMMIRLVGAKAEKLWERPEPFDRFTPPVLDGDIMFVPSEDSLMCLSWPDAKVLWHNKELNLGLGGGFVRAGDKLIMMTDSGRLLLVRATAAECKLVSSVQLFRGRENWATPLVYRGRLYVKGPSELICLDIRGK